jgi:hypothetical protein
MEDNEIDEILKKILGEDAFSNIDMKVSKDTSKLVKAVDYLVTQIKITGNMINNKEVSEHIKSVIKNTKDILS